MGDCMSQHESKFYIKADAKDQALCAIKAIFLSRDSLDWVDSTTIKNSRNLIDAMKACRWNVKEDEAGNIVGIAFARENSGDDLIMFQAIAPFVEDGSYIEMHGGDGATWRWVFKFGKCFEKTADVSWD